MLLTDRLPAYATFRPELEKERQERLGTVVPGNPSNDKVLSEAIISDIKEARREVETANKGGFAWGIRQAIFGKPSSNQTAKSNASQSTTASPNQRLAVDTTAPSRDKADSQTSS